MTNMRFSVAFLGLFTLTAIPASAQRQPAIVTLNSPPVVEHFVRTPREISVRRRLFTSEAASYRAALRTEKAPLVASIQGRGIPVDWQIETILNAVMIQATDDDLAWLRTQPLVTSAEYAPTFRVHMDAAAKLISAPAVWQALGGSTNAGKGIMIGIVDSGIDYRHPMFTDTGFTAPAGFPLTNQSTGGTFTNNKVIVAKNFVCVSSVSCPGSNNGSDLIASDGLGHGTFVASVAAGVAATSPFNTTISGIAPGAYLGNYKVFSAAGTASGTSTLVAIDTAVGDGMNIVNFSGGAVPSPKAASDAYNFALNTAANAGVLIVVSAGNCGPIAVGSSECTGITPGDFSISSPGESPAVLTAGASSNSHSLSEGFSVTAPAPVPANLVGMGFVPSTAPVFTANIGPLPLIDITSLDSSSLGCNANLLKPGSLTGAIAVISRGTCNFIVKVNNAAAAGAAAVLLYDNTTEALIIPQTDNGPIPSGIISQSDGANLLAFIRSHSGTQGTMVAIAAFVSQTPDLVANYSSRGPTADYNIKPDLVAPADVYAAAQDIYSSAEIYDASGFTYAEGTSFAAPMSTGSAAVLLAHNSALTPTDLKSALVNSATLLKGTQDGALISVINEGGGRLNLQAAMNSPLTANPVSVSFGLVTAGTTNQTKSVTLKNIGSLSDTFTASATSLLGGNGLQVSVSPATVSLSAGQAQVVSIVATSTTAQQGVFEGFVTLTGQQSGLSIHIPYWVMFGLPSATAAGVVDGAGFGPNVAPGSIISIFGSSLGGPPIGASVLPLPGDLGHSAVSIASGGTTSYAPMFFSSSGQLNLQLPFTATGTASAKITLEGLGSSISFPVSAGAPGIFNYNNGVGVVLHTTDYTLVTSANPAHGGEIIAIYCTGLGAVTPAVNSGLPAPASPLSVTPNPTVTIGGQAASVQFSGLAAGFVGLYQVNATIPATVSSGAQKMTMGMGGNTSNSVTIAIQ